MDNLELLRKANNSRQAEWNGEEKLGILFRAIEHGGESGELLNAVKKYYRFKQGIMGGKWATEQEYIDHIKDEIADVQITLDLLCRELDLDIWGCVVQKFNETSAQHGLKTQFDGFGGIWYPHYHPLNK